MSWKRHSWPLAIGLILLGAIVFGPSWRSREQPALGENRPGLPGPSIRPPIAGPPRTAPDPSNPDPAADSSIEQLKDAVKLELRSALRDWLQTNSYWNDASRRLIDQGERVLPALVSLCRERYGTDDIDCRGYLLYLIRHVQVPEAWLYLREVAENRPAQYSDRDRLEALRGLSSAPREYLPEPDPTQKGIPADYLAMLRGDLREDDFASRAQGVLTGGRGDGGRYYNAASALASMDPARVDELLSAWAAAPEESLRIASVDVLVQRERLGGIDELSQVMARDNSEAVRAAASQGLRELSSRFPREGSQAVRSALLRFAEDPAVLPSLIGAAADLNDSNAYATIRTYIAPSYHESIRSEAVRAVVALGGDPGVEAVLPLLDDATCPHEVRSSASVELIVRAFDREPVRKALMEVIGRDPGSPLSGVIARFVVLWSRKEALPALEAAVNDATDEKLRRFYLEKAAALRNSMP